MMDHLSYDALKDALRFQLESGVDETIGEEPIDRYALDPIKKTELPPDEAPPNIAAIEGVPPIEPIQKSANDVAKLLAMQSPDLDSLRNALGLFDLCRLKDGARSLVFSDGNPEADIMIIGEAPGREEDRIGRPFVGPAGQLLDNMFASIGRHRDHPAQSGLYITNVVPWRPPQNRDPSEDEIRMMLPFLERHITLVNPRLIVLMGNVALSAVLGARGITKARGRWSEAYNRPVLPMFHPAYLMRDPSKKKFAWLDLQSLRDRLKEDEIK